jgi:hypothetical protein
MDWSRVVFTAHMTEAATVVAECQVVFDFPPAEPATYAIKIQRVLKGAGAPFFAVGRRRDDPAAGFQPFGEGASPEEALQACLEAAGVHHRRRERQGGG